MVAVAGRQIVAGLGDADDRLAGLQLGTGEAEIQIALHIERGHARIMRIVEPVLRAKMTAGAVAGGRVPIGWLFCHGVSPSMQTHLSTSGLPMSGMSVGALPGSASMV